MFAANSLGPMISLTKEQEQTLIAQWLTGDNAAWREVLNIYGPTVKKAVGTHCRNPHDAEELVQDVFLRAHRSVARFRGEARLSTWLTMIARNMTWNRYHYWRRRRRECHLAIDTTTPAGEMSPVGTTREDFVDGEPSPSEALRLSEQREMIARAAEHLPARERRLIVYAGAQHTYEHIAQLERINYGTVKSAISRARDRLRIVMRCLEAGRPLPVWQARPGRPRKLAA